MAGQNVYSTKTYKENNDEKIMTIKSIFAKKETIQKENYNKKDEDIYASDNYSSSFDGIKGFSTTVSYFEYLEDNPFPYKLLRKLNRKLRDVKV